MPRTTVNSVAFGNATIGASPVTMTLTFDASRGALTFTGSPIPDFAITSVSCGTSCSVQVTFTPVYPGARQGSITATLANGAVVAETFVYGTGVAPLLGFELGYETVFTHGYDARIQVPTGVALGPDRTAYFTDAGSKQVYSINRYNSNSQYSLLTLGISGLGTPSGIAVDGNGTVYVADQTNNVIVTYSAAGVQGTVATTQLAQPGGLAVDGTGALYIADTGNGRVIRIDNQGVETTLSSGVTSPQGIAVDSAGDVFFNNNDSTSGGTIVELPAGGGTAVQFGSSLGNVQALALDAGGTIYYSTPTLFALLSTAGGLNIYQYGGDAPAGIAVGPNGDLYTALGVGAEFDTTDRSSGNFVVNAAVGGSAQGGLSIRNVGNSSLTLSNFSTSENVYTVDSVSVCGAGYVLNPATTCEATIDYNPVTPGPDQQTVNVSSNSLNGTSTVNQFILYGYAGQTGTQLAVSSNSVSAGQPVTFTATVSPQNGNDFPTGTVQFVDSGTVLGSGTLSQSQNSSSRGANSSSQSPNSSSQSIATFTTSSLSTGNHSIVAMYLGSDTQATSSSDPQTVTVVSGGAGTSTSLAVSSANIQSGTAETLTATIQAGSSSVVSGSVTFYDQNGALGTGAVVAAGSGGTASLTLTNLSVGSHQIYALYNGDGNYAPSTSGMQAVTVVQGSTTTSLMVSAASINAGQPETLTATIQSSGTPALTGPVTFYQNTSSASDSPRTVLGSATVMTTSTGGTASLTLTNLTAGTYFISAGYSGDTNFSASASATQTVTVSSATASTTTTLSVDRSSVVYRTPVAFSATVVNSANTPVTAGQVILCDVTAAYCSTDQNLALAQLNGSGVAVVRMAAGVVGSHAFKAVYLGTSSFATSSSATQTVAVTAPSFYPTFTTITSTGGAGSYTLTGSVTGLGTRILAPGGTVTFNDTTNANASLGTATLGASVVGSLELQPSGSPIAVGSHPYGIATGDFNGDGYPDIVIENYNGNSVSILLGMGNGSFQPAVSYAVGSLPERVLVADFNGDGKLDLVVANTGSGSLSVLLGNGDGTFQGQVTYACSSPVGLGVMDLNHDGFADIVAGDYYSNTVSVLLGNGDGTFRTAVTYPTGSTPQTLAEGDFNGDGNVDLAVGNEGGATVGILLGRGDGTFLPQVTYAVGRQPQGVQVGDFNRDGFDDLAVSNQGDGTISVLLGNGDGTFRTQVTYAVGGQPVGLAIADFNGDGFQDLSVGNTAQSSLTQSILFGNGDGTFQPQKVYPTGNFPYGEAVADFDGNGFPDLAISNFSDNTATILLSYATETATATITGVSPTGAAGTHNVNATYPGDGNFGASTSPAIGLTVSAPAAVATTTSLTIRPASATIGQNVGFFVSVFGTTQTSPTATGTVTLMNNSISPSTVLGTITLGSTGSGSFNTASLAAGSYSVTATYSGDANYAGSVTSAQTLVVSQFTSTATLTVSAANITVGQQETFSVNLQGASGVALTGTVTFLDGTTVIGSSAATLSSSGGSASNSTASLTLSTLSVGAHQIVARYSGDTNYSGSSSTAQTVTVAQASTTTTLMVSAASLAVGQAETLTAMVQHTGSPAVSGTVTFFDGTINLGSAALTATTSGATATLTLSTLSVGTRQIVARYSGDTNFVASVSAAQTVTVTQVATSTSLIVSAASLNVSQTETLTVTVAGGATPAVSGTVTFFDGTTIVGTVNVTATASGGSAALTLSTLTVATHQYSARYSGDANYAASASGVQPVVVSLAAQTITFPPIASHVMGDAAFALGATASSGLAVTYTVVSGPATISGGLATVTGAGTVVIQASQAGNATYAAATPVTQTFTVTALPVVTLAGLSPASGVTGAGATTITLTGTNFASRDAVQLNGASVASTFVNATTIMAVLPASLFQAAGTGQITVVDAASGVTTGAAAFVVVARPTVVFSGPPTSASGQQPAVTLQVVNANPTPITGTLTLTFAPTATGVDDPAVQFASGGRTLAFTIPANSTVTPAVMLQTGTVAGTATVTLGVISNGINVTPATAAPVVINIAAAIPSVTTATVTRTSNTLSVVVHGFSNTREIATAVFHFVPVTGSTINDQDITVNAAAAFATWYSSTASAQYGSSFTYTQQFTLDEDVSTIAGVTVTLVNSVGTSVVVSAQ